MSRRSIVSGFRLFPLLVLAGVIASGCGSSTLSAPDASPTGNNMGAKFKGPPSDAGLEVKPNTDTKQWPKLVKLNSYKFHKRDNPFALTADEKIFDSAQSSERIFDSTGGFTTLVEAKSEVAPPVYVETQPYRRLSGIVVGDSVVAIIEMGQGQTEIIRPGMRIPNSPWTVVSIDQDKAVLRRDGNVLPHEIEVRLEVAPPGFGPTTTGAGGGAFPGGPGTYPGAGGGYPGGGGFPGGGRGRGGGRPGFGGGDGKGGGD